MRPHGPCRSPSIRERQLVGRKVGEVGAMPLAYDDVKPFARMAPSTDLIGPIGARQRQIVIHLVDSPDPAV
jgi:hypothetical protein